MPAWSRHEDFDDALADLVRRPASRFMLGETCWRAAADLHRWPETVDIIADTLRAAA